MRRRTGPTVQASALTGCALVLCLIALIVTNVRREGAGEDVVIAGADAGAPATPEVPARVAEPARAEWLRTLQAGEKPPQFVLFSFDGAGSHDHWQRLLPIVARTGGAFSAFLSGIYLVPDSQRDRYTGPGHAPGRAAIGFGGTEHDVRTLVADLNRAWRQGIEVGTHYNGHFCQGSEPSVNRWSAQAWDAELDQFFQFVREAGGLGLAVDPATVKGGRTPCLEGDFDVLLPTLARRGMTYDSSRVSDGVTWPELVHGVWEFPLPLVQVPALGRKVIMMDYNLWYSFNGARDERARAATFREDTLATYRAAYTAALTGNRAPLVVGNHFNDWSGGGFSAATETFMAEVCVAADTVCATYSQVIEWMTLQDPRVLRALRALPPAQVR